MRRKWVVIVAIVLLLATVGYVLRDRILALWFQPTDSSLDTGKVAANNVEVVASNLVTPWSISFLPDGDMLVSERSGTIKRIGSDGKTYEVADVVETSEGGLLGITLHPEYTANKKLYLYFTTRFGGTLTNQVDVVTYDNDRLENRTPILVGIPAAGNHNGGAIGFGPDGKLYVATGDASVATLAQDLSSLAGKILRLNDDGSVPDDNPFSSLVWSYGHRNPQGIAWDDAGTMWSVEHGPSGTPTGMDELNRIQKGKNYGWPEIMGDQTRAGMEAPIVQSGASETWAPARMIYADGTLYFSGLRGRSIYQATINTDETVAVKRFFSDEYGRLRAVAVHENYLYFASSNRDGRGSPAVEDDRIFRVLLDKLKD